MFSSDVELALTAVTCTWCASSTGDSVLSLSAVGTCDVKVPRPCRVPLTEPDEFIVVVRTLFAVTS